MAEEVNIILSTKIIREIKLGLDDLIKQPEGCLEIRLRSTTGNLVTLKRAENNEVEPDHN